MNFCNLIMYWHCSRVSSELRVLRQFQFVIFNRIARKLNPICLSYYVLLVVPLSTIIRNRDIEPDWFWNVCTSHAVDMVVDRSHGNSSPLGLHTLQHVPRICVWVVAFQGGETGVSIPTPGHVYCFLREPPGENYSSVLMASNLVSPTNDFSKLASVAMVLGSWTTYFHLLVNVKHIVLRPIMKQCQVWN